MINSKTLLLTSLLTLAPAVSADILYDVSLPPESFTDGQTLLATSSNDTPSRIVFGSQEVRYLYSGLDGNSIVFNTPVCSQYDQIAFDLPDNQSEVYFEADFYTENMSGSDNAFSIFADGGTARSISFHGLGMFRLFHSGVASQSLFNYSDNTEYKVKIYANGQTDSFKISVNDFEYYSGVLGADGLSGFRLSLAPWTGAASVCDNTNVAVRNIKIYESPEDLLEEPTETFELDFSLTGPAEVSSEGGRLKYDLVISNVDQVAHSQIYWLSIALPSGDQYSVLKRRRETIIEPNNFIQRTASSKIPAWVPAGEYELKLVVVDTQTGEVKTKSLPFVKLDS